MSWPRAIGQIPLFYSERPSGRPFNPKDHFTTRYIDVGNDPLYPFGYGLTYGRFLPWPTSWWRRIGLRKTACTAGGRAST